MKKMLIMLPLLLLAASCSQTGSKTDEVQTVQCYQLSVGAVISHTDYPASIEGITDTELRPHVEGYITKLYTDEGARVSKGDKLFQIDPRLYAQQLKEAQGAKAVALSQLAKAQIELRNGEELMKAKVISSEQYDLLKADHNLAKANADQATAAVERAIINLDFTTVKAPVDGVIGKINFRIGALVGPSISVPLSTLSDVSHVRAYFSIGEIDYLTMMESGKICVDSTQVGLILANGKEFSERGTVDALNGKFSSSGGSILLRATFSNKNGLLRSGSTGKIRITNSESEVLIVPKRMTQRIQNKTHVFRLTDNHLSLVCIEVAEGDAENYIIRSGAEAGDLILSKGLQMAHDGMEATCGEVLNR